MKKTLTVILALCMCLTLGFALTACKDTDTDPAHTYKTEWSYDATHHWHDCQDDGCTDVSSKAEHTASTAVKENEVAATCTTDGSYDSVVYCSVCNKEMSRTPVTVNAGHNHIATVTNATCSDGGYTTWTCNCGDSYTSDTVGALGHNYGEITYTWANDNSTVTATRVCSRNSAHIETETVNTTSVVTQEQDCGLVELTTYTATFTNSAFAAQTKETVETKSALVHNYGEITYTWADDNSTVTATRVCSHNSAHVETETVNTTSSVTQNQTCTTPELTTYTATFANSAFTAQTKTNVETKSALGHRYTAMTYTWSDDGMTVTASRNCIRSSEHSEATTYNCTQGLSYAMNTAGTGYIVTGIGTANTKNVVIPNKHNDFPVVAIGSQAFEHKIIISVFIPETVTEIGYKAFNYCDTLESVTFASTSALQKIDDRAFFSCDALTSFEIPSGVTYIGDSAFSCCFRLVEIINKSDLNLTIGSSDYGDVAANAKRIIYNAIDTGFNTDENGFVTYNDGTDVWLVRYLGKGGKISVPSGVTKINAYAFYNYFGWLELDVTLPEGVTYIGEEAFKGNELINIHLPDSLLVIDFYAFRAQSGLRTITIPQNVTNIDNHAFYQCYGLYQVINKSDLEITVGDNVARYAIEVVTSAENSNIVTDANGFVTYNDGTDVWLLDYVGDDAKIVIPSTVTKIYCSFLSYDTTVSSVVIPASVTELKIEEMQRYESRKLVEIINESSLTLEAGSGFAAYAKIVETTGTESKVSVDDNGFVTYNDGTDIWLVNYLGTDKDIVIPNNVTKINQYAFFLLRNTCMESLYIPRTVTYIGFDYNCYYPVNIIIKIYYEGTEVEWNNITIDTDDGTLPNTTITFNSPIYELTLDTTASSSKYASELVEGVAGGTYVFKLPANRTSDIWELHIDTSNDDVYGNNSLGESNYSVKIFDENFNEVDINWIAPDACVSGSTSELIYEELTGEDVYIMITLVDESDIILWMQ